MLANLGLLLGQCFSCIGLVKYPIESNQVSVATGAPFQKPNCLSLEVMRRPSLHVRSQTCNIAVQGLTPFFAVPECTPALTGEQLLMPGQFETLMSVFLLQAF